MAKDLRSFLGMIKKNHPDLYLEIPDEVNSNAFELSALLSLLEKRHRSKIICFQRASSLDGTCFSPFVTKVSYTRELCSLALDLPRNNHRMELVEEFSKREKLPGHLEMMETSKAPCKEVIWRGNRIDLFKLPVPMFHEKDVGPFFTMACAMKGLHQDFYNVTFNKNWVKAPRKISSSAHPHHHLDTILAEYEKENRKAPLIVVLGHHPAFYLSSCCITPYGNHDYLTASAFLDEPLRVTPSETWGNDVLVPADAEIIVEGEVLPGVREKQNPFGEIAGYYQEEALFPMVEVTAVTLRKNAIMQGVFPGHAEHWTMGGIPKEGSVYSQIKRNIPGVTAVHLPESGCGRFACVIAIKKEFENEPRKAAMTAFTEMPNLKLAIVVDNDVDVYDEREVQWAVATRTHWDKDAEIIRKVQSFRPWLGDAVAIIDATRPSGVRFPEKNEIPREALKEAEMRWKGRLDL